MDIQQVDKIPSNSVKPKEKLTEGKLNEKIDIAQQRIKHNTEIIKRFTHDFEPHTSPEFLKALKSISLQYTCILNYDVTQNDRTKLRISIAKTFISSDSIDIFLTILIQLFDGIFGMQTNEPINEILYDATRKIMFVFFNYSDASALFGDEISKRDKFHSLYYKILVSLQSPCLQGTLHDHFEEILRITIATLYNTLLFDSEKNLQRIRELKYLDIIKEFLSCNNERIKVNSLLFTAYVANEDESMYFKSDQESVTYLLNLLSDSLKLKCGRAKGLSTEELAKGIEKLSKNDENKQLIVDLGLLPILERLLAKKNFKYKRISLSILWSLSFDERNRQIIKEKFLTILTDMRGFLSHNDMVSGAGLSGNVDAQDPRESEIKTDSDDDLWGMNTIEERSKCAKVLDGLMWTLQGPQNEVPTMACDLAPFGDIVSDNAVATNEGGYVANNSRSMTIRVGSQLRDSMIDKKERDSHFMISYCWDNAEIVMEIYNALKDLGYKLWIDKYNMAEKENLMESMAHAVENSIGLIVCISNGYKDSTNCRAEAQYGVSKKKPLIPVMVQHKYRPDGWLGFCITGLMYCDFKGRNTFENSIKELTQQLTRVTKTGQSMVDETDHITKVIVPTEGQKTNTDSDVTSWSYSRVKDWFKEIGIKKIIWKVDHTGKELSFLKDLSFSSPDTFFMVSQTSLELKDLKDLRIFFEYIKKL